MFKTILDKIAPKKKQIPTTPYTSLSDRYEPDPVAPYLSADRILSATEAANNGDTSELFTIYRDIILTSAHIQAELHKRKLAVLSQPISIMPWDEQNKDDQAAAHHIDQHLENTPHLIHALAHLLDATIFPVAIAEKIYAPEQNRYTLRQLIPVPAHLLSYADGALQIRDTTPDGQTLSTTHHPDPERYVIHRSHLLSSPDKLGGPMRAILYWYLFATKSRDWWMRFLERYGMPFIVGKYEYGNDEQRLLLQKMIRLATKTYGVAITADTQVELLQAAQKSGDAFQAMHEAANKEISKLIVGQTLSAEAHSTGLGSGVADAHEAVRADIRRMDSKMLAETIREQIAAQILRINNIPGTQPRIAIGSPADPAETLAQLKALKEAGLQPADEALDTISDRIGFPVQRQHQPQPIPLNVADGGDAPRPFRRHILH